MGRRRASLTIALTGVASLVLVSTACAQERGMVQDHTPRGDAIPLASILEQVVRSAVSTDDMLSELQRTIDAAPGGREPVPAAAFALARGTLTPPVKGSPTLRFGETASFGGPSRGVVIEIHEPQDVLAPANGWVVFAGEFRSYGPLIILQPAAGYLIIFAGSFNPGVRTGDAVAAGNSMASATVSASKPASIYVEMRKDLALIDPWPWLTPYPTP